ncbi:hypothetical protein OC844_007776 [Tilletia horrida]|nr:hypothetical protein OC844_007776 [Tilletia horrida]
MKFTAALFSLVAAVASVTALPSGADPDFTISQADLDGALTCPGRASYMGVKNPLLLVPGTGTTGAESWDNSFAKVAPSLGFEPCYISPAPYLLNDTTLSAQYFVNAVRRLTAESGKAVPVMGWSQG